MTAVEVDSTWTSVCSLEGWRSPNLCQLLYGNSEMLIQQGTSSSFYLTSSRVLPARIKFRNQSFRKAVQLLHPLAQIHTSLVNRASLTFDSPPPPNWYHCWTRHKISGCWSLCFHWFILKMFASLIILVWPTANWELKYWHSIEEPEGLDIGGLHRGPCGAIHQSYLGKNITWSQRACLFPVPALQHHIPSLH